MRFSISSSSLNGNTFIQLSDNNHSTGVTIIPEAGALLHTFIVLVDGQPFNIIENYATDRPVREQVTHYFRSAKLSPWPCRLADGRYQYKGKSYQVSRMFADGTALHGLLFDQEFRVIDQIANDEFASVTLQHDYGRYDPGYPFPYRCTVKYELRSGNVLNVTTILSNTGYETIPIADGWHPYFQLGGKVDGWELFVDSYSMVEFDERLIPTGGMVNDTRFADPTLIGNTRLDNCFPVYPTPGQPVCTIRNPTNNLLVSFIPDNSYPYLQLFIPDERQSIAVENLSAAPDSFNNKLGLLELTPGTSKTLMLIYSAIQIK